jgi:hypothetical protein
MPEEKKLSNIEEAIVLGLCHKYAQQTPPYMPEKRDKWGFNDYLMVWLSLVACSCIFFAIGDSVGYQLHEEHYQSLRTAENAKKTLNYQSVMKNLMERNLMLIY